MFQRSSLFTNRKWQYVFVFTDSFVNYVVSSPVWADYILTCLLMLIVEIGSQLLFVDAELCLTCSTCGSPSSFTHNARLSGRSCCRPQAVSSAGQCDSVGQRGVRDVPCSVSTGLFWHEVGAEILFKKGHWKHIFQRIFLTGYACRSMHLFRH